MGTVVTVFRNSGIFGLCRPRNAQYFDSGGGGIYFAPLIFDMFLRFLWISGVRRWSLGGHGLLAYPHGR